MLQPKKTKVSTMKPGDAVVEQSALDDAGRYDIMTCATNRFAMLSSHAMNRSMSNLSSLSLWN